MRFQLDTRLTGTMSINNAEAAQGNQFAEKVFSVEGVASIFGVNDFVTVTRRPDADWDPIIEAVQAAAAEHL